MIMMLDMDITLNLGGRLFRPKFQAGPGITVLFGASGVGKTSILNAVAGLATPTAGHINLAGRALWGSGVNMPVPQRRVGYVFQNPRLFPHLSIRGNLLYGVRGRGSNGFDQMVDMLNLSPLLNRKPHTLSGGEAQRVALGRALLSQPDVLLLDEPLSALDARLKGQIYPYFEQLRQHMRGPILYVTHDIFELSRLADTVVLLGNHGVQAMGPTATVLSDPAQAHIFGPQGLGSVLVGKVTESDHTAGYTLVDFGGTSPLRLPYQRHATGAGLRARIAAQDVILSLSQPGDISAVNVLPAVITQIEPGRGPSVIVQLALDPARHIKILARVTRQSADRMGLAPDMQLFAVIKASAFDPSVTG